jgi:hypothetical protein
MAANTSQIFSRVGQVNWTQSIVTANTALDGTGTVATIFTADATNGGRVEMVRARALGTNVATVLRVFINNGSSNATPANNTLWAEITLPATTASAVAALTDQYLAAPFFPLVLGPGYKLNVTIGTTVAGGYSVTAAGGAY